MATPISALRRSNDVVNMNENDNMNNVIDDVINEMNNQPPPPPQHNDYRANINAENYNYATDYAQIPQQPRTPMNFLQAPPQYNEPPPNILSSIGIASDSSINKLFITLRLPVIIFVIIFVVSLPPFNRSLFSLFPSLIEETGNITYQGVALKSFVGVLFYFIINHFLY